MNTEINEINYDVEYFCVRVTRQENGCTVTSIVSPPFHTRNEAAEFKDNCGIEGAKLSRCSWFCSNQAEHDETYKHIFEHEFECA